MRIVQPTNPLLRPTCRVSIDGADVTARILPRLCQLTIETSRQDEADTVRLTFEDTDGHLALPRRGVEMTVMLGFEGRGVALQGTYHVDEVEHSGTPDTITVVARSAKLTSQLRARKERAWRNTTVGHIVRVIAGEHQLTPKVSDHLGALPVEYLAQTESDIALLRRLGRMWDAVATVKAGHLLFTPIGRAQTASGKPLDVLTIVRADGDGHRYHVADRDAYTGVRARWHDFAAARGRTALAGKSGHVKILRGDFASREDAERAAAAELARIRRGSSTFSLSLAIGRPDIYPEMPARTRGWKPDIDATEWIVARATHSLTPSDGYTTELELENKAAASDSAAVDEDDMDTGKVA
jgi:phage protein D